MDGGRCVEYGTYEELMAKKGRFYELKKTAIVVSCLILRRLLLQTPCSAGKSIVASFFCADKQMGGAFCANNRGI